MLLRPSWTASPNTVPLYPWLAQEIARHFGAFVVYMGENIPAISYTLNERGRVVDVGFGHPLAEVPHVPISRLALDLMQLTTRALVLDALASRMNYRAPWMLGGALTTLTEEQASVALAKTVRLVGSDPKLSAHPLPRAVLGPWQDMAPVFGRVGGRERRVIAGEWSEHGSSFNGGWASSSGLGPVSREEAQGRRGREGGPAGEALADAAARTRGALLIEDLTLAAYLASLAPRPSRPVVNQLAV